jgi:hypothetical protein
MTFKPLNHTSMRGVAVNKKTLMVPKKLRHITLWVHPEGRVLGGIYVREQSAHHAGEEQPLEILNQPEPFVVVKREDPAELRFYNKRSIIRVEYDNPEESVDEAMHETFLHCRLQMMDGSLISGTIQESLPPDRARLLDYLNRVDDGFIKLTSDEGAVYLINKAYIIHVHAEKVPDDETEA